MPDIQLLPEIAVYFGCSIDDLFDLSEQAQFDRIENMLEMQETLTAEEFQQCETFFEGASQRERPKKRRTAAVEQFIQP